MAAAIILKRKRKLKELEVLVAEAKIKLAVLRSARASRASSTCSGQAATGGGSAVFYTQSGRAFVSGETTQQVVVASERELSPGEPGQVPFAGSSIQKHQVVEEWTEESEMLVRTNRGILDQSCVVETWRSVQLEVRQKGHLASEAGAMQATANVKHEEIVHNVTQRRWGAARLTRER